MKLVLLVSSVIAVYTADSPDFPDKPDDELHSPDDHRSTKYQYNIFTDQPLDRDPPDLEVDHGSVITTDEPQDFYSTELNQPFIEEREGRDDKKLRGTLKKEFKKLQSLTSNMNSRLQALSLKIESLCKTKEFKTTQPTTDLTTQTTASSMPPSTVASTPPTELKEVNFGSISGGRARATSIWDNNYSALQGFAKPGYTWHSISNSKPPQSVWYEFPNALRVVKFSFQSRTDSYGAARWGPDQGPSSYEFWGSNNRDCNSSSGRVVLVSDMSGTPFTLKNLPKTEDLKNPNSYRCYGCTVKAVPANRHVTMSNIRYWYN